MLTVVGTRQRGASAGGQWAAAFVGHGWPLAVIAAQVRGLKELRAHSPASAKPLLPGEVALHRVWGSGRDDFGAPYGAEERCEWTGLTATQLGLSAFPWGPEGRGGAVRGSWGHVGARSPCPAALGRGETACSLGPWPHHGRSPWKPEPHP